ncbi:MAG: multicopper oxidase family protein [Gammaproteobacteria bacterium]|nr:multicopper oxidase family protein [Gammaproteobacteria bacterium]MYC51869.1 multicopper oxidase family protein [Gammaproteobacteria bacterium]
MSQPTPVRLLYGMRVLLLAALPGALAAQEHQMMGHGAHAEAGGWRMPPMDMTMPMVPGLENALPPVSPFLIGDGMDPAMFPAAEPSRRVVMADGDTLDMDVSVVRRTIGGRDYAMLGYGGQYPGPLIQADRGSRIVVRVTNRIQLPTAVHWHGIRLENRFDGVAGLTQDPIAEGETFTYEVDVPDAGMFWYHPHMREDIQQDLGLYGNLLVTPPNPDYYGPSHREEPLLLDDILIDEQGLIPWGEEAPTHALMGRFGTVMLTNGVDDHRIEARAGEVVRFYLTNVANTRTFNVRFGNARVKLIASDIGKFERETWVESVVIAPAERYVVDVRFPEAGEVGITNTIQAVNHFRGTFYPHEDTLAVVSVNGPAVDDAVTQAFDALRENRDVAEDIEPFRALLGKPVDYELVTTVRVRDLPVPIVASMEADTFYVPPVEWNDGMPMMNWLSTGTQVTWILREPASGQENGDIQWRFRVGDVVKIRVFNDPESFHPMNHPIHIHGQRFLVTERDGVPNTNLVWKDTTILPVGSTMDLLVEMSNPGSWMVHCHIAEHLHAGMMFVFEVTEE